MACTRGRFLSVAKAAPLIRWCMYDFFEIKKAPRCQTPQMWKPRDDPIRQAGGLLPRIHYFAGSFKSTVQKRIALFYACGREHIKSTKCQKLNRWHNDHKTKFDAHHWEHQYIVRLEPESCFVGYVRTSAPHRSDSRSMMLYDLKKEQQYKTIWDWLKNKGGRVACNRNTKVCSSGWARPSSFDGSRKA